MATNANSALISALLKDANVGTFTGIVTTKKGVERGPKGSKVRYGDDTVHACIFTGFKYVPLCQRSLDALTDISDADVLAAINAKGAKVCTWRSDISSTRCATAATGSRRTTERASSIRSSRPNRLGRGPVRLRLRSVVANESDPRSRRKSACLVLDKP